MLIGYRTSTGSLQASPSRRDVLPSTSDSREIDEASGTCDHRSLEASRCSRGHGVESSVYGYERCRKDFSVDHHELHVRLHAIQRENKGRILKSREQEIIAKQPRQVR